jgi:hypothetical protein
MSKHHAKSTLAGPYEGRAVHTDSDDSHAVEAAFSATGAPRRPAPEALPPELANALAAMRKGLADSRLGHLGRRIEMSVREQADAIETYGKTARTGRMLGGAPVEMPMRVTATTVWRIECNGRVVEFAFQAGAPVEGATASANPSG